VPVERQLICSHLPATTQPPMAQYSAAKNDMLRSVDTEWMAVLNDDDNWLPHHVETILPHLDGADLVYTWEANNRKPRVDLSDYSAEQLTELFDRTNVLDGNLAIRTSVLRDVGGFPVDLGANGYYTNSPARYEDWELWRRMVRAGHTRFRCVPVETWEYEIGTPGQICG